MLRTFLIFCISIFMFTGCSSTVNQEEITFSSWGSQTEVKILQSLILNFEKENPDIKVKFLHFPQNYFQKLHLLFASNQAPDVIFINNINLPIYQKYLEDLTNVVNSKDFYESSIAGLSYEDKLLAVPRDISTLVLYVNLDLMNLPQVDWTIEDLFSEAKNIKSKKRFGISYEDKIYWVLPYLSYFGGEILDKNGELNIGTTKFLKAISFYKDLKNKYNIAPRKDQIGSLTQAQMFLNGEIGMYLSGRWIYPKIKNSANFEWAIINFPYGEIPQLSDCSGWAISKNSKQKEAAFKFVKYISSTQSINYLTDTGLIIPARIDSSKKLNNAEHNEFVFVEMLKKTKNTPVSKNYNKIIDYINQELNL